MAFENNYTLGRGEIYFARRDPTTGLLGGERYLGNTPECNLSAEEEKLDHFSSDRGVRVKDRSVTLQVNYTGSITTDNVDPRTLALFFLGTSEDLTIVQSTVTDEVIAAGIGVEVGMFYQLGTTDTNRTGARKVIFPGVAETLFVVKKAAATLVPGTDYILNADLGRIEVLAGGALENGDLPTVTYTVAASTRTQIISGSSAIEGALRYVAYNPEGADIDYFMPAVTLAPNGDLPLKGEEWMSVPFNLDVTKKDSDTAAIYADGRAVLAA